MANVVIFSLLVTVVRRVFGVALSQQDLLEIMGGTLFGALFAACGGLDGESNLSWRQIVGLMCFGSISFPISYVLGRMLGY